MPGFRGAKSNTALYRSTEHKQARSLAIAALNRAGSGTCAERVCVMPSRLITPAMQLHLCHDRVSGMVLGLGHARCNRHEAASYGGRKAGALKAVRQGHVTPLRW